MKIPGTPNGVKSTAIPTPYANTDTRGAFGASFASTIDKVDNAVDSVQAAKARQDAADAAEAEKVRRQAKAISKANADAAYQRSDTELTVGGNTRRDLVDQAFEQDFVAAPSYGEGVSVTPNLLTPGDVKPKPGYFSTRGKEAYAKSGEVLTELEKRRQQIAKDHFADPADREEWLAQSADMFAGSERRVEQHAAQQFEVAEQDALKGMLDANLNAIATATDPDEVSALIRKGSEGIRSLQKSKEGGDAAVQQYVSEAAATHVAALLDQDKVAEARAAYNGAKVSLGQRGAKVLRAIEEAEKVQERRANDVEAERQAIGIINQSTRPNGSLDREKMNGLLEKVPAGPLKDEIRQRAEHGGLNKEREHNGRVSGYYDRAFSTYLKTNALGAVDAKTKQWLIDNAPDEWAKLVDRQKRDRADWQRKQEGKPITPEAVQALIGIKSDIDERGDYYRGLAPADFFRLPEVSKLPPDQLKEVSNYWVGMKKRDPIPDAEFNREVTARIGASEKLSKDKDAARRYRARANKERLDFLARNNNKEPDYAQRDVIFDATTRDVTVPGRFFGTTTKQAYEVDGTGPEAGPLLGPPASAKPLPNQKTKAELALDWARKNPNDPRAAAILKKLGVK